tara:strand:- start:187 stop:525 length:339 start_codon:yes stop_codon:yes gene_type:complete
MGMFSWITSDTKKPIVNKHYNNTFDVKMLDNNGNEYIEGNYNGYGVFGNKDYYVLLAEMNGLKTRDQGLKLSFSGKEHLEPKLVSKSCNIKWLDLPNSERDPHQGFGKGDIE